VVGVGVGGRGTKLSCRLTEVRQDGTCPWLRPDGKTQVRVGKDKCRDMCDVVCFGDCGSGGCMCWIGETARLHDCRSAVVLGRTGVGCMWQA
jgi:hypothetical protein